MNLRRTAATLAAAALTAATAAATLAPATAIAADTAPKASLTDIENDVMCVSCHEPLAVAQSPQAIAERNYVRTLIAQGQTKAQIEQALVGQYGPAVLGKPPAHGFNLTVYILPPLILIAGIGTLVLLLPKWRRRSKAKAKTPTAIPEPSIATADAHRLDEELRRYGG
jgi:cytochrome c-type biogenesis protein CcmH